MSFPDDNLKQTAVYWANPVADGYGGFTWDDPVEIDCRWVNSIKLVKNVKGEQVVSQARVQVNQDLDSNGMLYLGTLDDLDSSDESSPETVTGAYHIIRFDKTPTVKANAYYRKAYL